MLRILQSWLLTSLKVYRLYTLYTKKPNKALFYFQAMRAVLLLIIGLNMIAVAGAASEWEEHSVTIKWGESISISDYNITAVDFRPGTVEEITNKTKCEVEPDSYKRKVWGCDDWVLLSISRDGNHVLDAALAKENHTYVDGAEFLNETSYQDDESSLRIIARDVVTGYNIPTPYAELTILVKEKESFEFDIAKNLTINKVVPLEANVNPCYPSFPITLTIENTGIFDFPLISVTDRAGDGFISEPRDLNWTISLYRGEMWQIQYLIKPVAPVAGAQYTLPPAVLYVVINDKTYNLSYPPTGNVSLILRSSDIILSKTAGLEKEGNVTINLSAKNNGSRASAVKVRDSLHPGMEKVSGDMNFSIVLQPGTSYNQSYVMKINNASRNVTLSPANFTFDEYRTCYDTGDDKKTVTGSGISNPVELTFASAVSPPVQTASPPAPTAGEPSIEATPANIPGISGAISISGYELPYTYLAILAGALVISVILFLLKVWRLLGLS